MEAEDKELGGLLHAQAGKLEGCVDDNPCSILVLLYQILGRT
jgi:hypothetical protein